MPKPPLRLQTTTLWEYSSQHYGDGSQGDKNYPGATPSYILWNLLSRYTRPRDLVVDPMAGSGTTLDVARDLGRRALGYDVAPTRDDIFRADARKLPLEDAKADFVFVDPPYSTHIKYSGRPECIGELDAGTPAYFKAMDLAMREMHRVLRPERFMALYVSDSFVKGKSFIPIGMELYYLLSHYFAPVDIVAVVRHNAKLEKNHWHTSAIEGNYFLRGFHYLFIMYKESGRRGAKRAAPKDRRDPAEIAEQVRRRMPKSFPSSPRKEKPGAAMGNKPKAASRNKFKKTDG